MKSNEVIRSRTKRSRAWFIELLRIAFGKVKVNVASATAAPAARPPAVLHGHVALHAGRRSSLFARCRRQADARMFAMFTIFGYELSVIDTEISTANTGLRTGKTREMDSGSGSGDCETEEDSAPEACVSPDGPLLPSNSREMRNRAEKLRRDKLNDCIRELGEMVPMVSRSPKRVDKTSILRLTASHLRIHQILLNGFIPKKEFSMVDPTALEQLIYEQLEGFLLILTPTGKIVFISHTVEQLLGHLQTDLMGHSIYTIASSDDHDKLRLHLSLDTMDSEWRRYFNLSLAKAGPRTESPTYEHFNVMGIMRPSQKSSSRELVPVSSSSSTQQPSPSQTPAKPNNTVLVFFVKLYRPPPLSEMLIEANKEEYITRHFIDGRIINCDHRISFVAGYMIEEVSGLSAFKFMHREDVRWTMIALRQMYDRGESVGWSCYRLLSRTGQFIYLRTFGYLEVDNSGVVESFVCVNTLVTEDEGKKLIREMKERYSVMINANAQLTDSDASNASVEDPVTLDECIKYLITNHVPTSPKTETSSPSAPCENQDCYLTELGPGPGTTAVTTVKGKRAPTEADDAGSATRKRQKRRTVSSSSGDTILEPYPAHHHRIVSSSSSVALGTR